MFELKEAKKKEEKLYKKKLCIGNEMQKINFYMKKKNN